MKKITFTILVVGLITVMSNSLSLANSHWSAGVGATELGPAINISYKKQDSRWSLAALITQSDKANDITMSVQTPPGGPWGKGKVEYTGNLERKNLTQVTVDREVFYPGLSLGLGFTFSPTSSTLVGTTTILHADGEEQVGSRTLTTLCGVSPTGSIKASYGKRFFKRTTVTIGYTVTQKQACATTMAAVNDAVTVDGNTYVLPGTQKAVSMANNQGSKRSYVGLFQAFISWEI